MDDETIQKLKNDLERDKRLHQFICKLFALYLTVTLGLCVICFFLGLSVK